MTTRKLVKFSTVVMALGGMTNLARLTGARLTAVSNWKARGGKIPARHYALIMDALARQQMTCARSLFTFEQRETKTNHKRKQAA